MLCWCHALGVRCADLPCRVSIVSEGGQGTLTIRDVKESDQGAYTCEAINTRGMVFGIPDSILTVTPRPGECPQLLPPPNPTPPHRIPSHPIPSDPIPVPSPTSHSFLQVPALRVTSR